MLPHTNASHELRRRDTTLQQTSRYEHPRRMQPAAVEDSTEADPVGSSSTMLLNTTFKARNRTISISIPALVDSGATNCYIDKGFVDLYHLPQRSLSDPLNIYNADGSENTSGCILSSCTITVQIHNHIEDICFYVTALNHPVILGFAWLVRHNPEIDWRSKSLTFSRCPSICYKHLKQPSPERPDPCELPRFLGRPGAALHFEPEAADEGDSTEPELTHPVRKRKRTTEERLLEEGPPRRSARQKDQTKGSTKPQREGRARGKRQRE
ncbi:hypothetical protein D9611_008062 [Ephemerocybe angulata]|uniref:Uncharacterized protein n=1 Tax=Ephemerocybe angulata TaxID=980116 RepID=A0A8H5BZS3_9AGAR|nr:hypothetical protein D9611_008062 [Tulosesus angulatus]